MSLYPWQACVGGGAESVQPQGPLRIPLRLQAQSLPGAGQYLPSLGRLSSGTDPSPADLAPLLLRHTLHRLHGVLHAYPALGAGFACCPEPVARG